MSRVIAHAKINLYLEITGKRPDGYHTLSTIFQTISLGDELTFVPAQDLELTCSDPSLPVDERNLVMKAAMRLRETLQEPHGAKIYLKKNVPMGAGLGGGSSDAAATLKALLKLWKRRMSERSLAKLAVQLGADVPFFLKGGACAATGIGDNLRPLKPLPKTWLVIVYPGFGVSTKEAYSKVKLPFTDRPARLQVDPRQSLFNRFESFVFPGHPELPRLKQELLGTGATAALMSGSGSAIFGLTRSRTQGTEILSRIQKKYNQCWLVHTL
jgi:4-diphosphocytidyl-2-C-methyl-D-erythritol kinase